MSLELRRGLMGNKTPIKAVEVTGGSIKTSWIPLAGAIVKWDWMSLDNPTGNINNNTYFMTTPYQDSLYKTFASNNGNINVNQSDAVYCWFQYAYLHGAQSNWLGYSYSANQRMIYTWDSLNGKAGFIKLVNGEERYTEIKSKKTTTSGYPLQLFCGRDATRMIIYKVELINQEEAINAAVGTTDSSGNLITREKCTNMTLIPTIRKGVVGFKVKETGEFLSSDNGVPFTKYE